MRSDSMCSERSTLVRLARMCSRSCPWSACRIVGGHDSMIALEIAPKLRDFSQFPSNAIYPVIFVRDNVAHVLADARHVHKQSLSARSESEMQRELMELMELYFDMDAFPSMSKRMRLPTKSRSRFAPVSETTSLMQEVKKEPVEDEKSEDVFGDENFDVNVKLVGDNNEVNYNEEKEKDFNDEESEPDVNPDHHQDFKEDVEMVDNALQSSTQEDINEKSDKDEISKNDVINDPNLHSNAPTTLPTRISFVKTDSSTSSTTAQCLTTPSSMTTSTPTTTASVATKRTISCGKAYTSYNGGSKSPNWRRVKDPDGNEMAECLICLKVLRPSSIGSHVRLQHRDEGKRTQYHCDLCPNVYTSRAGLRDHYRKHTGEEPYCCVYCGKTFKQVSRLNICMRRHEKNFLHTCKICGRGFYQRDRLKVHMRSHTGEKPYGCVYCSFRCSRKSNLFIHVRGVHKALVEPSQPVQYKEFKEDDEFELKIGGYVLKEAKETSTTAMDSDSDLL